MSPFGAGAGHATWDQWNLYNGCVVVWLCDCVCAWLCDLKLCSVKREMKVRKLRCKIHKIIQVKWSDNSQTNTYTNDQKYHTQFCKQVSCGRHEDELAKMRCDDAKNLKNKRRCYPPWYSRGRSREGGKKNQEKGSHTQAHMLTTSHK